MKLHKKILLTIFCLFISLNIFGQTFPWRGCMIDVSRHFFDINFLYKQVDILSKLNINILHLHLVDGGGWRMEIKEYPNLTELGAWRSESDWDKWWGKGNNLQFVHKGTVNAYGGYYTQQQLKDLVKYASSKGITIVPEIEMPGHSEEVMECYPALKCEGNLGQQSDLCPSNPLTYRFLESILKEVVEVFPSEYIHLGGDEAGKQAWAKCPRCRKMVKTLKLKSTDELQDVMMRRMTKFVKSLGKKSVVWDEALTDGLASGTVIMVWRNSKTAQEALKKGYDVVLSPTSNCYLDYYQDVPYSQPRAIGGYLPFDKVYSLTLIDGILGIQGNLWTEYIPTSKQAEYMLYPRMVAIAEIGNKGKYRKPLSYIRKKAIQFCDSLRREGINTFNLRKELGQRVEYYKGVKNLAKNAKVQYITPINSYYPSSGDKALVDGLLGGWEHGDGRWQGFPGKNGLDVIIDLGEIKKIKNISAEFLQLNSAWIYFPQNTSISISNDNVHFRNIFTQSCSSLQKNNREPFQKIGWKGKLKARYIRWKSVPPSNNDWIFLDEIIVR